MNYLELQAQRAQGIYEGWLASLRGVFALALEAPDPTIQAVRNRYLASATALGVQTIGRLQDQMREIANEFGESPDSVTYGIEQAKAQVMRDVAVGFESLRKLAFELHLAVGARANFVTALIRARRNRVTDLRFEYVDRVGRKWSGARYVRTIVRHFAVTLSVVAALREIAVKSDLAQLKYPEPDHEGDGLVFSISGATPGYPSYRELDEKGVFHPNVTVKVVPA